MQNKVISLIKERRLPWFLESRIKIGKNRFFYLFHTLLNPVKLTTNKENLKIMFICGFHGISGGVIAISNIANLLAKKFKVFFHSLPNSYYNILLDLKHVILTNQIDHQAIDLYICDVSINHNILMNIRKFNKPIIVTCHCFPYDSHGLTPDYIFQSLSLADFVHFVSNYQKEMFNLDSEKSVVIPNFTFPIIKTKRTKNIGIIGRHFDPIKNSLLAVKLAIKSNASEIHLWGDKSFSYKHDKVKIHGWTNNKKKIYNSFDVLLSLSKKETFGMTVIEAMSCGISCLLSDIPVFRVHKNCPGVRIISSSEINDVPDILNDLLKNKEKLRKDIIEYWKKNFSPDVVLQKWESLIYKICK